MTPDCWNTIAQVWRESSSGGDDISWFDVTMITPLMALMLAVLLAPVAQVAYSRRVQRLMGFREVAPAPQAWWQRRRSGVNPVPSGAGEGQLPLAQCMQLREARIRRASLAAWMVLVIGSFATMPFMVDWGPGDYVGMLLFVAAMGAGPVLVNVRPHGSKALLLVVASGAAAAALKMEEDLDLELILITALVVAVIYLTSVHRTMRALVVPLVVLCCGAMLGTFLALLAMAPGQCIGQGGSFQGSDWLIAGAVTAAAVGVFCASMWLAARGLDGLAWMINRGWMSDVSVVAAAGMLLLAALAVIAMDKPSATPAFKFFLLLAWVAAFVAAYVAVLRRHPCPQKGRRLLMLRVFSRDHRAERLLDTLQSRWQLAGPVLEIGGPDLVKLNLDINEFIKFATFRLHELFQPSAVPADVLAHSLDLGLDREGRFRVNELFCFDTSWKAVVEQLLAIADVVLLDLRGFNDKRSGTSHEVERLAARSLLPRVVAIGDAHTDWAYFDRRVAAAGPAQALALRVDSAAPRALEQCLERLLQVANAIPA